MNLRNPQAHAKRVIELHGGHDRFFTLMNERLQEFNAIWDQDSLSIGRVLRAHLVTEYFLTMFLAATNPRLGDIKQARLTFSHKVALLPDVDPSVSFLKPGLRRLNTIRNRLAHNLQVAVTKEDRNSFLSIKMFAAMRAESVQHGDDKPDDPMSIFEQFSIFAAALLHASSNPERDLWRQAARESENAQQSTAGHEG